MYVLNQNITFDCWPLLPSVSALAAQSYYTAVVIRSSRNAVTAAERGLSLPRKHRFRAADQAWVHEKTERACF